MKACLLPWPNLNRDSVSHHERSFHLDLSCVFNCEVISFTFSNGSKAREEQLYRQVVGALSEGDGVVVRRHPRFLKAIERTLKVEFQYRVHRAEFYGKTLVSCFKQAEQEGWRFQGKTQAACPDCVKFFARSR